MNNLYIQRTDLLLFSHTSLLAWPIHLGTEPSVDITEFVYLVTELESSIIESTNDLLFPLLNALHQKAPS